MVNPGNFSAPRWVRGWEWPPSCATRERSRPNFSMSQSTAGPLSCVRTLARGGVYSGAAEWLSPQALFSVSASNVSGESRIPFFIWAFVSAPLIPEVALAAEGLRRGGACQRPGGGVRCVAFFANRPTDRSGREGKREGSLAAPPAARPQLPWLPPGRASPHPDRRAGAGRGGPGRAGPGAGRSGGSSRSSSRSRSGVQEGHPGDGRGRGQSSGAR